MRLKALVRSDDFTLQPDNREMGLKADGHDDLPLLEALNVTGSVD